MDKFSGLKAATYIAAKNFERWSKLAALTSESSSALHSITLLETSQLLSALLAELEAKDKRIAELQRANQSQDDHINQQQDRIDSLEKKNSDLGRVLSAAEKLVRCKGRYHSEQNYRALAGLFGVTTPDLPPVGGDSEAVIAELRAKLATPVRLSKTTHPRCRLQHAQDVRAAGFTVEGGE